MSDYIYKVFPAKEVSIDKTGIIKEKLIKEGFISGEEFDFYGEKYLKAGNKFCDFLEVSENVHDRYKMEIRIVINPNGYGVQPDEEEMDFITINRKNVIEIWNIDGDYTGCDKLCDILKEITGDEYLAEIEIL
jgi:hypothetical protein